MHYKLRRVLRCRHIVILFSPARTFDHFRGGGDLRRWDLLDLVKRENGADRRLQKIRRRNGVNYEDRDREKQSFSFLHFKKTVRCKVIYTEFF